MTTKKNEDKDQSTAHKHVPGDLDQPALGNPDGAMPMGMTGTGDGEGDPDQKSTHNAPKTVESNLPDGSPKFMDSGATKKRTAKAGRYEVVSRISTSAGTKKDGKPKTKTYEPGEFVELDEAEAESLGENIKPAR